MKIAIVVDDLIQRGGQEKLTAGVSELFPTAPIYTVIASDYWLKYYKNKGVSIKSSFMQKLPFATKLVRYYFPLMLHPIAFEKFDFTDFDVVLSISARYAHFSITRPESLHICYMNTPGRMFWEPKAYFEKEEYGLLKPLKRLANGFLSWPLWYMRMLDYGASNRVDFFMSNSKTAHDRVKKYYGRSSQIVYPFVDTDVFTPISNPTKNYFLIITRLAPWKRVDIAVEACTKLGLRLVVLGEGPDKARLQSLAGPTVEFKGYVSDEEKIFLVQNCTALINTQFEDFGIVPVEAMSCGRPVIAYGKGGVLETVKAGETGEFFTDQTASCLAELLSVLDDTKYDPGVCRERALLFSKNVFADNIISFVKTKYSILS